MKEVRSVFTKLGRGVGPFNLSQTRFRFAYSSFDSLGKIGPLIATSHRILTIFLTSDDVSADLRTLLVVDVLDDYGLTPGTVANKRI